MRARNRGARPSASQPSGGWRACAGRGLLQRPGHVHRLLPVPFLCARGQRGCSIHGPRRHPGCSRARARALVYTGVGRPLPPEGGRLMGTALLAPWLAKPAAPRRTELGFGRAPRYFRGTLRCGTSTQWDRCLCSSRESAYPAGSVSTSTRRERRPSVPEFEARPPGPRLPRPFGGGSLLSTGEAFP